MDKENIYSRIPEDLPTEIFEEILKTKSFHLERIISNGHATESGKWLHQDQEEWVILLKGDAGILFEGDKNVTILTNGDYIHIPAHRKHRVEWTKQNSETIWLALHFSK